MTYLEQIKNPMWQRKRLEIFERDEFMCQSCGDTENQLQVHHKKYIKNSLIWEYKNNDLITLCDECHEETTELKRELKLKIDNYFVFSDTLIDIIKIVELLSKFDPYDLNEIHKYLLNKIKNG